FRVAFLQKVYEAGHGFPTNLPQCLRSRQSDVVLLIPQCVEEGWNAGTASGPNSSKTWAARQRQTALPSRKASVRGPIAAALPRTLFTVSTAPAILPHPGFVATTSMRVRTACCRCQIGQSRRQKEMSTQKIAQYSVPRASFRSVLESRIWNAV